MKRVISLLFLLLAIQVQATPNTSLTDVTSFDHSHVGAAGSPSPNYEAFEAEVSKGRNALPIFEKCLHEGTAASKLYAAVGLYHLDPERGTRALASLEADSSPVTTTDGCELEETTVGKVALQLRTHPEEIRFYFPSQK